MTSRQQFDIQFYNADGSLLGEKPNIDLLSTDVRFSEEINKGQVQLSLTYHYPFDNSHPALKEFNFIRLRDKLGRLLFTGYISQVNPYLEGREEGITIIVLGLSNLLNASLFKDGASFKVSYTEEEPAIIIGDIISDYQSVYPPAVSSEWIGTDAIDKIRSGSQVYSVGTNVSVDLDKNTWLQAINKTIELTEGDWFWFVDAGGDVIFSDKPAIPLHEFTIGKDISSINIERSMEEIINRVTVEYGNNDPITTITVEDTTSINTYGLREEYVKDDNINDSQSATSFANKFIADRKNPKNNISLEVLTGDVGYQSLVRAGETCKIENYDMRSIVVLGNLLIHKVEYTPTSIKLDLEGISLDIGQSLSKLISKDK